MTSPPRAWWRLAAAPLAVLAMGTFVACDDEDDGDSIEITNARARFTTTDVGAVYFDIRSTGPGDRLVGASAEIAADAQVHEIVSEGGSSMMRAVEGGIPIDPGGHVSLEPGGYHVMVLGVDEIPEPGTTFEVVLEFETAGRMTITVHVQEFGDGNGDVDHGEMDHE
ncbi:MAG: copper chaperone PCu(A)C [Dehalococcoidia bacterium]|nr:copper chaperone PCu(A)C [Dehalococcoidia bacterium]MYD28335.1 copper chaperone PCu(A)C [Dehalococcoidia bacterium]